MAANYLIDKNGIKRFVITVTVNGDEHTKMVKSNTLLVNFLRDELGLTGTKRGCEEGDCGSCTVILDGKPVNSCMILALEVDGSEITTIEGIADGEKMDIVQEKFLEYGAIQCGYCSAGMIVSARALLDKNPKPTVEEIKEGIQGNLCRCTGYVNIIRAITAASGQEVQEVTIGH
jgi:carbon-monoxide dehydrogenase small subunit